MSLGIVIKSPEGIVMGAESRVTMTAQMPTGERFAVTFDNATKVLSFTTQKHVGAVTYGQAVIGRRTASSFLPELEASLPQDRMLVEDFAKRMSQFFLQQWNDFHGKQEAPYEGPPMIFLVGGFDEGAAYGRVFEFHVPSAPDLVEHFAGDADFGLKWGGQTDIVSRLVSGFDMQIGNIIEEVFSPTPEQWQEIQQKLNQLQLPLPIDILALQDCVDLANFLIRTTISAQNLTVTLRGVGGPIDLATITRQDGLRFVQRKQITGS